MPVGVVKGKLGNPYRGGGDPDAPKTKKPSAPKGSGMNYPHPPAPKQPPPKVKSPYSGSQLGWEVENEKSTLRHQLGLGSIGELDGLIAGAGGNTGSYGGGGAVSGSGGGGSGGGGSGGGAASRQRKAAQAIYDQLMSEYNGGSYNAPYDALSTSLQQMVDASRGGVGDQVAGLKQYLDAYSAQPSPYDRIAANTYAVPQQNYTSYIEGQGGDSAGLRDQAALYDALGATDEQRYKAQLAELAASQGKLNQSRMIEANDLGAYYNTALDQQRNQSALSIQQQRMAAKEAARQQLIQLAIQYGLKVGDFGGPSLPEVR